MKPYETLTQRGKLRRLRQLVLKTLEHYDINVKWVKFMTIDTNTMFKIQDEVGEKYVMRIYSDEETTLRENQAEIFWLTSIVRDTNLKVTEPVARRDGAYINLVSMPGIPGEKRCVLFRWVPGQQLEKHLNAENYYNWGQAMAQLHKYARTLNPLPQNIQPKKWDKVFYYPDEPIVYNTPAYSHLFPPERQTLLNAVIARANIMFERLYADTAGQILIHGDLHFWNVHIYRGDLYLIDFEDVMRGYPIQDVAVTLSYGQEREGFPEWREAFQQGYSSVSDWPVKDEADMATLIAARSVMFINYVARIDPQPQAYVATRCERLKRFLDTYK